MRIHRSLSAVGHSADSGRDWGRIGYTKPFDPLFFSYQRDWKPSTRILRPLLQPVSWKRRELTQLWYRLSETLR